MLRQVVGAVELRKNLTGLLPVARRGPEGLRGSTYFLADTLDPGLNPKRLLIRPPGRQAQK